MNFSSALFYTHDLWRNETTMPLLDKSGNRIMLTDYTWTELDALENKDQLKFILPLGATEQHGPHLTLDCDTFTASQFAQLAAQRSSGCIVMPALPYGHTMDTSGFCGTVHLSAATFIALLLDIAASVYRHGFRKLVLFNGHGGNTGAAQAASREILMHLAGPAGRPVTDFHVHYYASPYVPVWNAHPEWMQGRDFGHACEMETSVLLALDGNKVRMDKAGEEYLDGDEETVWRPRDMATGAPGGVHGAPRYSSREKGEAILEEMIKLMVGFLEKI
jgi:creatinine amidohydrolase/Fe(II)-dependent formamide hydrolase-like protein